MKKILVTSALPYVNNIPHLGNLIGSTLSADVYARAARLAGKDVLFVCGADEHGTATETRAKEEGLSPQELCDKYVKIHKDIYDWFSIDFDVWGRTHTDTHKQITQDIFQKLYANKYIIENEVEQLYDEKAKQFLADRFVEGTCPYCDYERARGDQCDNCQKLINAPDLKDPISKLTGTTPIIKTSNHLFLDLPSLAKKVKPWFEESKTAWTENSRKVTEHWLENVKERAITRDLKWGVSVPLQGWEEKVFYVWFDAPIGYISITAHEKKDWKDWWQNSDVELVQFMGKDNIVFHSVIFPATLLGTGEDWTLLDRLNSTEYLNLEAGKFSKSNRVGVFGDDCKTIEKEYGIPADCWRYYLLAIRPETADTTFSWDDFQSRINNELLANWGNLVNRTVHFAKNRCQDVQAGELDEEQQALYEERIPAAREKIVKLHEQGKLREALAETMLLAKEGNAYFQHRKPWEAIKEEPGKAATDILVLLNVIKDISILLQPYIPTLAKQALCQTGTKHSNFSDVGTLDKGLLEAVAQPKALVSKIEDETKEALKKRYGKKQLQLDLRVARITEAAHHSNADKLFVLQLDLGEEKRQLVTGLRDHYDKEELQGKSIVIIANLKPAKLRGELSEGMLLATDKDDDVGILLADAKPGTKLLIGGEEASAEEITFEEFGKHDIAFDGKTLTVDGKTVTGASFSNDKGFTGKLH